MSSYPNRRTVGKRQATGRDPNADMHAGSVIPFRSADPDDLRAGFEFLYALIQSRVIDRLEDIFERVRRLDEHGGGKTNQRRAIRLPKVLNMLGISKSTLYSRLNPASPYYDEAMPRPFKLGNSQDADRCPSVWWENELAVYLELRASVSQRS